jgi:hypothetical protein
MLRIVARLSVIAVTRPPSAPEMRVTSAASMATSVPVPMANPTSAWARAGASLMPSPTMPTNRGRLRTREASTGSGHRNEPAPGSVNPLPLSPPPGAPQIAQRGAFFLPAVGHRRGDCPACLQSRRAVERGTATPSPGSTQQRLNALAP